MACPQVVEEDESAETVNAEEMSVRVDMVNLRREHDYLVAISVEYWTFIIESENDPRISLHLEVMNGIVGRIREIAVHLGLDVDNREDENEVEDETDEYETVEEWTDDDGEDEYETDEGVE